VQDAEPPIDYDSPYSPLPSNVNISRVKKNVEKSYAKMFRNKTHRREWMKLFETEHANALISDGFWFVICKVFKKGKQKAASTSPKNINTANNGVVLAMSSVDAYGKPVTSGFSYEDYKDFLLDRIAANYVSFTILEDEDIAQYSAKYNEDDDNDESHMSGINDTSNPFSLGNKEIGRIDFKQVQDFRRKFFEQFYDVMAQSVYYSLFYAYPKSRGSTNNDDMKRKLLNIFSKLFTGMRI
jgi:hypothetical protein